MQKITPFLWFDGNAEEAVNFYVSTFKDSKITSTNRVGEGSVTMMTFQIEGQEFYALNGGPHFEFSSAISFFVDCKDQAEVDRLWDKLSEGGEPMQCGWIKDRFGVTWQIIPTLLGKLLQDKDPNKSRNVMQAMMQMIKIDSAALMAAYERE